MEGSQVDDRMTTSSAPARTPLTRAADPSMVDFGGPKYRLLLKEGIHYVLDKILNGDDNHLVPKCPLYGRLSKAERCAAAANYASALLLRRPLVRNIIVDLMSNSVYGACELVAREECMVESKRNAATAAFMQQVIGDAMEELLENTITKRDRTIIQALKKQEATSADIARATHRMKTVWLGARCVRFFDSMLSAETMPTLIYDGRLAGIHGVEYFLAEIPFIGPNDERHLSDAIHIDEEENGKETVFAKNLKVVLGRVKQKKKKSGVNRSNTAIVSTGFGGGPGAGPTATLLASTEYEKVERNLTRDIERVHRFWNRLAMEKKREATTLSAAEVNRRPLFFELQF